MKIEKLKIKNFKALQDVEVQDLPNFCVFLGANGVGKTTLFDVFGFLSDCLKTNVKNALNKRGGFYEVYSRDSDGDIAFEIKFRNESIDGKKQPLITYELAISLEDKQPVVKKEILSYRRGQYGKPYRFLEFSNGKGSAIINEDEFENAKQKFQDKREEQQLDSPEILALKGLGQFQKFKAISSFRRLLENWYVSNLQIQAAQSIEDTGISEHLSTNGNNLAQVTKHIRDNHKDVFDGILEKMIQRVPGVSKVDSEETIDGRIVLKFQDGSFKDPFIARYVSDGTIKMFAYLVLLNDPQPFPLLCVEEPENFLHPKLLAELAEEFREYSQKGGQVFVSSHSPEFVNALKIDELFWISKENGYSKIYRAKDDKIVCNLVREGDQLGSLWNQNYLKGSNPND
ncbi:ATPase [Bacteroidia bacterium]|nr:ATPase [Bacteroidia bacterium]